MLNGYTNKKPDDQLDIRFLVFHGKNVLLVDHSMEELNESTNEPLKSAEKIGEADIVVGIPFANEIDMIGHVCETLVKGGASDLDPLSAITFCLQPLFCCEPRYS